MADVISGLKCENCGSQGKLQFGDYFHPITCSDPDAPITGKWTHWCRCPMCNHVVEQPFVPKHPDQPSLVTVTWYIRRQATRQRHAPTA